MRLTSDQLARHEEGVDRLSSLFKAAAPDLWRVRTDGQTGRPRRVRLRPGVPPLQSAAHRARRKARKTAHESRRRNRPC